VLGVMSAQRLSHNSAGKLTVFVETNDRSRAFYVIISLLQTGERERCAHFVTLLAAFVPTVATSGNVRRTKKAKLRMCERTRGRAHHSTNKCFNRQLSADNKKPLGLPPVATVVITGILIRF